jgi:hypothetical protein
MSRAGKRVASLLAVAMLGTTLLVFAAPAASAADSTKFCAAVDTLQTKLDDVSSTNLKNFASTYRGAGSAFKTAAKSAPPKVKAAMNRIGSYLASVGSGDFTEAAQQLGSKNGKAYSKALVTYSTYVSTNC